MHDPPKLILHPLLKMSLLHLNDAPYFIVGDYPPIPIYQRRNVKHGNLVVIEAAGSIVVLRLLLDLLKHLELVQVEILSQDQNIHVELGIGVVHLNIC